MSEGELKKRMPSKNPNTIKDPYDRGMNEGFSISREVVDEAKQEYLKKCKPAVPCKCDECKWFKKWFGDVE